MSSTQIEKEEGLMNAGPPASQAPQAKEHGDSQSNQILEL
jgi:hypothetical protein